MTDRTEHRIGIVSTRLAGTDGVSLEVAKWSRVLEECGHACFYFAGESDLPEERSVVVPEAHFEHPDVKRLHVDLFDDDRRSPATTEAIHELRAGLKKHLARFLDRFDIELMIVENALSLPMNVPLGLALTELIVETAIPTIAHHHDFTWERARYKINGAEDFLQAAFPPKLPAVHNVVINSHAASELARRTGMRSTLIPNVMDYDRPPPEPDAEARKLRAAIGVGDGEAFLLQPTRIVPRKRIERAIELARWLDLPCCLAVSHESGDEGHAYQQYLRDYAEVMGVRVVFAADRFNHERATAEDGSTIYALADAYQQCDLVTYPSRIEGFGNAFLEAIYYRRPIVMSSYEIFKTDLAPKGFQIIEFGEFITYDTVGKARQVLRDRDLAERMAGHNYELARQFYSFSVLRKRLTLLIDHLLGRLY